MSSEKLIILEAFYGGSHKQLIDYLLKIVNQHDDDISVQTVFMTDKKWHWRMRTSALYFAEQLLKTDEKYSTLFVSSVVNLAELLGLRPDLNCCRKILYFHENQLIYPVRKQQERDFQYGYNQILSCLVSDIILFNSSYNMTSFLNGIKSYMKLMPDYRPKNISEKISEKCQVLYFPLTLPARVHMIGKHDDDVNDKPLHIVWAHRWEHDKNPEDFFEVLFQLQDASISFFVSVVGQTYKDIPEIFNSAKERLGNHLLHYGYQESKDDFINILRHADVAVSTANHEFFGVSMLEAVAYACYPLCPNRLAYPEIFPAEYLYNTKQQLFKKLKRFCCKPNIVRSHEVNVDVSKFDGEILRDRYLQTLIGPQ